MAAIDKLMKLRSKAGQDILNIFRGEGGGSRKNGPYWSESDEFARQFTQTGRAEELRKAQIKKSDIYEPSEMPYAGDPDAIDAIVKEARQKGFKAVRLDEGGNEPPSVYVFNQAALNRIKTIAAAGVGLSTMPTPEAQALQDPTIDPVSMLTAGVGIPGMAGKAAAAVADPIINQLMNIRQGQEEGGDVLIGNMTPERLRRMRYKK